MRLLFLIPLIRRPQLNIDCSVIFKPADINKFDYLNCVNLLKIDSDVDLILGKNKSNAFIQLTVIEPPKDKYKNGPYAILNELGGVLSGLPAHNFHPLNHGALNNFFIQNDSTFCRSCSEILKPTKNETLILSLEQQKFMKHASENIRLNDKHHFGINFPLKNPHLKMYSNKEQAV